MEALAASSDSKVRFVEEKHSDLLQRPVVLEGELTFTPPDTLERRVLKPRNEVLRAEGNTLTVTRAGKPSRTLDIGGEPVAQALVEAVRGTLSGDLRRLQSLYNVEFSGALPAWRLILLPKAEAMTRVVEQIQIRGHGSSIETMTIQHADGDRTVMFLRQIGN